MNEEGSLGLQPHAGETKIERPCWWTGGEGKGVAEYATLRHISNYVEM